MSEWPTPINAQRFESIGAVTSGATTGTTLTAGLADQKGDYTELINSTAFNAVGLLLAGLHSDQASGADYLIDVAIGPAGSEQIVISNLLISETTVLNVTHYYFPIAIPAGSRISARCQSSIGGALIRLLGNLIGTGFGPFPAYNVVSTYGANTADSGGTSIDPGASVDTKGAFVQLTNATTYPIKHLNLAFGGQTNVVRTTARWLVDIAIGPANTPVVENLIIGATVVGDAIVPGAVSLPVTIPAGSRISARAQCSITDATDRLFDLILYGTG